MSADSSRLYVGGLALEVSGADLHSRFTGIDGKTTVSSVDLKRDAETGLSRGFAYLTFSNPAGVDLQKCE
jgi:RNA recognition motif-containing protein